ncbi:Rv3235 family protein [Cellulomonas cellasea]|uniref:Rv3235 family protein n=1 Tax=Cellulomonas cellasea TaxID=43670 RepID=UPI00114296B9|nr:Rv3235 family protein [Cellulomonas cellasea]
MAPASRTLEARLVPTLPPAARPAPSTGPGHTRPPTLEQRLLARRRATLAAERAARAAEPPRETAPMPDPTPVCCALALAATEALRGTRSVAQLARWVSPQVFEQLAGRTALTVRVLGRTAATRRPEILRVRVCRLGEHIAEAAVVVDDGTRVRAIALRLEMWRGAWRAVAFEIG